MNGGVKIMNGVENYEWTCQDRALGPRGNAGGAREGYHREERRKLHTLATLTCAHDEVRQREVGPTSSTINEWG